MPAKKIMVIRHAEKPAEDDSVRGVAPCGCPDPEELIVRGWQRSGALVRFFKPRRGKFVDPRLATPSIIFASKVGPHSKSLRPQHTVLALATKLKLSLTLTHAKGEEEALVTDALAAEGPVLIAWEHEAIPRIANLILGNGNTCPQKWPGSRFDLVWVFDRSSGSKWSFGQVPQMLLPGDINEPI
jgi:hypothetical protein